MSKYKEFLKELMPTIGLILLVTIFAILTDGRSISAVNIKIISNQIIVVALVSLGAIFPFACGAMDMSIGGTVVFSAIMGSLVAASTESFALMAVTVVITALTISLIKGVAAAYLTLPVFIVTLIFGTVLGSLGLVALGDETTRSLGSVVPEYNELVVNLVILFGFFFVALVLFNYTRIGKSLKLLGGNPKAAEQSGISRKKNIIIAFLISGVGVSLATIITIMRTKTVTAQTGGTLGFDLLIAIVIGGMPLTGGPRSKISAGLVGAAIITVLNNGLGIMNVSNDTIQIIRGVIFLSVVFLTSLSYRTKLLPR